MTGFTLWREEPIQKSHPRVGFDCGEPALNEYLLRHARQNHDRGVAKTILAVGQTPPNAVMGYYSLSPASLDYARVPEIARRGGGRYEVPGFRLGRLAVSLAHQGQGLGGQLLLSAARRCLRAASEVGGTVLVIDAKSPRAANWYQTYGAFPLLDAPLTLVLPLATIAALLEAEGKL